METRPKPLRALLIEDEEDDVLLLLNELKRGGYHPVYTRVDTPEVLVQALYKEWDIIFCDYSMPRMNGRQALNIVRQINQDVPFVFVSGTIGEDIAVEAMRTGAQDYIMKGNLKRLVPAVHRELAEAQTRMERRAAEKRLHFLANYDNLTHLPNRVMFLERLNQSIHQAREDRHLLAVAHLDLDRFKTINDSLGYKAGDMLLREAARRLSRCVNAEDVVARLAADEFAILLTEPGSQVSVAATVERVLESLAEPFDIYGCTLFLNASLGVALYPYDASSANDLLRNADIATYRTKDEGGKGYRFYTREMAVQLEEQLALEQAMQRALQRQEFLLHYQPQVDLQSHRIVGLEALLRWNRPQVGMVSPDRFIPLAEETGVILPLGEWVLREVCAQARHWRQLGLLPTRIAVNISARQFLQGNLEALIKQVLEEFNLEPHWLEVEITESSIMQDTEKALHILKKLQSCGVTVALDDFGTGYSSLSYLKHFKIDTLKIDRTFIKDVPADEDDTAITSAVIAMASKLNIKTVAEGVETVEQHDFLRAEGCNYVQGYYLCRPMEVDQITELLQNGLPEPAALEEC